MVRVLQARGHAVEGVDSYLYEDCTLGPDEPFPGRRQDIRDLTTDDLHGFDAVVHLAALCNDPLGDLNADWTADINHRASVRLAQLARDAGVRRFLYASSCSLYGAAGEQLMTEEMPMRPLTAYAISKVRTEEDVTKLADAGFSPVFMRNATAYGMSPRFRGDIVLNNFVCWAHTTGRIRIMSDGTPWRPIVHIEDISRAFAEALVAPREAVHNQAFNIGANHENYQVRDLATIVERVVPGCRVEYAEGAGPDPRSYRVDFSKFVRMVPAFAPRWTAERGAQEMYDAVRACGLTEPQFQSRRVLRLAQLKHLLERGEVDDTLRHPTAIA